jgi:polyisoprenoid-binding protein YceI
MFVAPAAAAGQGRNTRAPRAAAPVSAPTQWHLPADSSNTARFTVREQLVGAELPNDAIGITRSITGGIVLDAAGRIDSIGSHVTVDMRTLTTDRVNRDRYIKSHTLVTDSFPYATFVPQQLRLTSGSLTGSGPFAGTMLGTLTLHGTTSPAAWTVTGTVNGNDIKGTATTHIHFADYRMTQPRLMLVMSIVDDVKLDYDFHFVKS